MSFRPPLPILTAPIIALLLSAACGAPASERSGDWVVERDTIGDTIVVRTLSGSVWGTPMELKIDLSIGTLEGDSTLMFGFIQHIAVDAEGGIYAFDGQVPALRYFNARGEYVRTLGREGAGPGEYRDMALGLAVLSDGRVVMRDPRNARLNFYAPDGTPSDHWPVASGLFVDNAMVLDRRDHVFLKIMLGLPEPNKPWRIGLLHYDATGHLVDTIPPPATSGEPTEAGVGRFLRSKIWALSLDGTIVVGTNDQYVFELRRPDGTVVRIERAAERVSLEPGERAEHEAMNEWTRRTQGQFLTAEIPPVPATKPFFSGLHPGERGRVWVRRYVKAEKTDMPPERDPSQPPSITWLEPTVFDVFESDGTYLGEVRAPPRTSVRVFRGDTIWGIRQGELDEQYLVRAVVTDGTAGAA